MSDKNGAFQGPVVQNIVSLMSLLRGQIVKCSTTLLLNTLTYFVEKCEKHLQCKTFKHFFQQKNISLYKILTSAWPSG